MDPADVAYEKTVNSTQTSLPLGQGIRAKKSRCGPESTARSPENDPSSIGRGDPLPIRQVSYEYQHQSPPRCRFLGEGRYHRNCPIEDWPQRSLLARIFYEQNDEEEPEQKESINSDEAELWYVNTAPDRHWLRYLNAVQLYVSMRYEATSLKKTIFKDCYVIDRNINLMGLDWMDEFNLVQFPVENETCQTPALESTNSGNLVRGCNQCLYTAEIPHPSIQIQSPKPDSPRNQI
ncbi:hypothetical protein ACTXT7_001160 [Hymenolepis weldensis]